MVTMSMRLHKTIKAKAAKAAKAKGFTLSAWIRQLIKEGIEENAGK